MAKKDNTTPETEAASGVTTETATADTTQNLNAVVEALQAQVTQLKKLLEIETERANAADARAEHAEYDLAQLQAKYQDAEADKITCDYNGVTYEFTQVQFRYRGQSYDVSDALPDDDIIEELIDSKSFILKPVE